ncbi:MULTISPECIES: cobaltochelatase subunit CobN [unclassified Novosphingobium]|uniref:cobaltochelatase subunit CobN n=1 Tax=unclassified Novosphingobium TaxID=2644732 RepID=UPI000D314F38|nr:MULTISPECIES: cobaltochelatase subunit CobN [unclassified Novosphingobium]PTR07579.1 cobaltochelatase CobN subunit [Novosphingobium sp. GV055]PUB00281.1 cobaltochelatase CobN subunit [Novosphingobium sp. GV061]PUB15322.1 cobaltochelatase CobN subunit [Novosphingobium sp. GV079]PUB39198.1 cobaltochelatase CobN subunit [Novosphingobium sp. GV027]
MHVIFRESHGLEETAVPQDLEQVPAPLVVLSFSDSDLGAFAAGWHLARQADPAFPLLRLANLAALEHPLSVDTYIERTLVGARAILIRLIGGVSWWRYGLGQVAALARARGVALAVLPADGRADPQLDEASTLPREALRDLAALCEAGGADAAHCALMQLAQAGGLAINAAATPPVAPLSAAGLWHPHGKAVDAARPLVLVVFYRAYLTARDVAPVTALITALEEAGLAAQGLYVTSLKEPQSRAVVAAELGRLRPAAIINATAFSAQDDAGQSPLDLAGVPVFQVALATGTRENWTEAVRGLAPADLAMHVVLPEIDGRLFAGVASFKEPCAQDADLGFARHMHRPDPARINAIVARVAGWIALARRPVAQRRLALVLSTYPGKAHAMAHAVGLDALASTTALLADLAQAGYEVAPPGDLAHRLGHETLAFPLAAYRAALVQLPAALQTDLAQSWGAPEDDTAVRDGAFHFAALRAGQALVALQPERGDLVGRDEAYHDLSRCPRHGYVAFYLWLRAQGIDALVHMGAHGTLEWLPGKAVALSGACWPEALIGSLPVIYPFIVNDPGEAAQAKRRIGAVTLGHMPPPLRRTESGAGLAGLEALLDEFSGAVGLDPARRDRLIVAIRAQAQALGLEAELGIDPAATPAEAIARIDRFVCDVKDSQYGDGLHIFGRGTQGGAECDGVLAALDGRRVAAGPAGSPWRGRTDVLPTGRNLYAIDPRAVPSRAAHAQGVMLAQELVRRHLQDHGDYPHALVVDLWGSATMRTGGEEFAMALHLLGARPEWDAASQRVTGIEILPIARLDHPRLDVTLRISGLLRDAFPLLPVLFGQAVRALAARDEPAEWNPFVGKAPGARVYGPAPGRYGLGMGQTAQTYDAAGRHAAGEAWLAASDHAFDTAAPQADPAGLRARVAAAGAFVHAQDLPETDLLLAADYAAHEAGFAAAQGVVGGGAALYHLDSRDPARPVARPLGEELARVVRARAAHPGWIAGMMRHGFRGGAELAATLDHLGAFAHLAPGSVPPQLFDLYYQATLGDAAVRAFLARENPGALAAMQQGFAALHAAGLWATRRNAILADLADHAGGRA